MNAREFRIRNLISIPQEHKGKVILDNCIENITTFKTAEYFQISSFNSDFIYIDIEEDYIDVEIDNVHPIPINIAWLKRIGFEYFKGVYKIRISEDKYIRGQIFNDIFNCCIDEHSSDIEGVININIGNYKFVHQLQNLHYSLTGQELTIKDNE